MKIHHTVSRQGTEGRAHRHTHRERERERMMMVRRRGQRKKERTHTHEIERHSISSFTWNPKSPSRETPDRSLRQMAGSFSISLDLLSNYYKSSYSIAVTKIEDERIGRERASERERERIEKEGMEGWRGTESDKQTL